MVRFRSIFCSAALIGCLSSESLCKAVIIIEKNVAEPVRGYLVDANADRVIVDVLLPNGETRQRILPRSSIEEMIQAVSRERLESLRSDRPQDYRDYAEELAGKTNDPDAQRTAIRLYQIAAHLAPEKLGRSCLLGMIALARNREEERKFRAAAYLLDSEHDRSVLRTGKVGVADGKLSDDQRKQMGLLLRSLREGRVPDARVAARRPALQEPLRQVSPFLVLSDFDEIRTGEVLPPHLLFQVLAAEMALDRVPGDRGIGDLSDDPGARPTSGWSRITDPKQIAPLPVLTFELLTEFDPRQCHFRNGKWEL
jgi:hypothetical protein